MPAPIIYSTTGSVLSSDEIVFAQRVAASFSLNMGAGWIKIIRQVDPNTNAVVEYHVDKNIAYVTPGGVTDYVDVPMPNLVPYRGIRIGVVSAEFGGPDNWVYSDSTTYVMTSDGVAISQESIVSATPDTVRYIPGYRTNSFDTYFYAYPWSGGESVWMFDHPSGADSYFHHKNTFVVPEDCIYPIPSSTPPTYTGVDGLSSQWNADWSAGVSAFNIRKKLWLKKNSDECIAALKTGFAPGAVGVVHEELQTGAMPAHWEYMIKVSADNRYDGLPLKDGSVAGEHTVMPIILSITSAADVVVSDTSDGLTTAGVKTILRKTTFAYVDETGVAQEAAVDGYLSITVTQHTLVGGAVVMSRSYAYTDWYVVSWDELSLSPFRHQFFHMNGDGLGCVVNGVNVEGRQEKVWNSGIIDDPLPFIGCIPPYPSNSNTSEALVGTAPAIFLQYHNTVLPEYVKNTAQFSQVMNNSVMYGVTEICISPVGLIANGAGHAAVNEPVGMFSVEEDGTQVEIYGTAVYTFNWLDGSLTFKQWEPLLDGAGNEVTSKVVELPAVWSSSSINCVVTYKGLHWPDVIEYVNTRDRDAKSGTFAYSDPNRWAIVQALK